MPTPRTSPRSPESSPHRVVLLTYDGIQGLDLVGPLEVFSGANSVLDHLAPGRPRYRTVVTSVSGAAITTESNLSINTVPPDSILTGSSVDTLVIPGGIAAPDAADDVDLVAVARRLAERAERVVTICTGVFVAAAAGLTDGKRVSTHWARAGELRRRFPDLDVDAEPIFVRDGRLWSSAGVTAGIDLTLALVEDDHGSEVAQTVARWLVMFLRRPGGQTQFATPVWSERAAFEPVRTAQDLIDIDPGADHRVALLAEHVGMSERNFTRRFTEEVGSSPAQYVAAVRIEAARRALESSDRTVEAIARDCGFGTAETLRRSFSRRLDVSPDQYRQRFRTRRAG
jgi:transcriptional regulator GlxA family with amidase domain